MRFFLCLLVAFPCLIPAQIPQPNIRSTSSEVLLDFVVRDRHARIIRDLRPDEVQVFEDGVPQVQRYFQFRDGHSTMPPSREPAQIVPASAGSTAASTLPERW